MIERAFVNEFGNHIKITIEGPASTSENVLTPMEFDQLRKAMVGGGQDAEQVSRLVLEALVDHNDMLRSAYHVALRKGENTGWDALAVNLLTVLKKHHKVTYEARVAFAAGPSYTTGHCDERKKFGGCQLHNLHCGFPDCDRRRVGGAEGSDL